MLSLFTPQQSGIARTNPDGPDLCPRPEDNASNADICYTRCAMAHTLTPRHFIQLKRAFRSLPGMERNGRCDAQFRKIRSD